jgi:hypothetical protein
LPRPLWLALERMTAKNPHDRFTTPQEVIEAIAPFAEGNQLTRAVRKAIGGGPEYPTEKKARSDTLVARSMDSDTLAHTPPMIAPPAAAPQTTRETVMRALVALGTLAAVAAIGWLAIQATGRRQSVEEATKAREVASAERQQSLQVAARYAASEILKEIRLRFDILRRLAADEELQQQMDLIDRRPNDEAAWKRLENWLGARKADTDREAAADSWFINDARGVQIARSPRSDTVGENFSHRDYFHGQGVDLDEGTAALTPISAPHLSAVYRSTSTGLLKVAFSVPIENGRKGKDRKIVGVLAMAVDLGEFGVLERDLPKGYEVVLIDLRKATIDDETRSGLVLHHQARESYRQGQPPPWVDSNLLTRLEELVAAAGGGQPDSSTVLRDYADPVLTGGKPYWGAIAPVIERRTDEPEQDYRWLVLVQRPATG